MRARAGAAGVSPRWKETPGGSARPTVRDGQAAVLAERLGRHAYARRRLATLVLVAVDHPRDASHEIGIVPELDQLTDGEVALHVALDDRIEHVVRRERV